MRATLTDCLTISETWSGSADHENPQFIDAPVLDISWMSISLAFRSFSDAEVLQIVFRKGPEAGCLQQPAHDTTFLLEHGK